MMKSALLTASILANFASGQDWTEFWNTFDSSLTMQQKVAQANQSNWTKDRCTEI